MLLISYGSVAGWFRVWSVCVKAQLHVQSSRHSIPPSSSYTHTPFACLTFFFFHHWLSVWGWEGPLGSERGFNEKREVLNPRRKLLSRGLIQSKSQLLSLKLWL